MTARFGRIYHLDIGEGGSEGTRVQPPLHCTFDVMKDDTEQPNTAQVQVWNLARSTSEAWENPDMLGLLYAGYEQESGAALVTAGNITYAWTEQKKAESITHITWAEGYVAVRDTAVSLSYGSGVHAHQIIQDIAKAMGLILVMDAKARDRVWDNGFSFYGAAHEALHKVTRGTGLEWSIQNRRLVVVEGGETVKKTAFVVSAATGMLSSPQRLRQGAQEKARVKDQVTGDNVDVTSTKQQKDGWRVRSLLLPTLEPADPVKIKSGTVTGWFKVKNVRHTGDYGGPGDWQTVMEVVDYD